MSPLDAAWMGSALVWVDVTAQALRNALIHWAGTIGIPDLPDDLEVQMVIDQLMGRCDA